MAFRTGDYECFPNIRRLIIEAVPLMGSHELQEFPLELVVRKLLSTMID